MKAGNPAFDAIVTKFLTLPESRFKKTKGIVIQLLVLMVSTEAESAQMNSTLMQMKSTMDESCSLAETLKKKGAALAQQVQGTVEGRRAA